MLFCFDRDTLLIFSIHLDSWNLLDQLFTVRSTSKIILIFFSCFDPKCTRFGVRILTTLFTLSTHTHTQKRFESLGLYILKCQIIHFLSCTKIIVGVNLCLQVGMVWFVSIFIYIYTIAHKFLQRNDLILHILMSLNLFCGCFFDIIEYYFWENKRWQQTKYKPWFEEKKP